MQHILLKPRVSATRASFDAVIQSDANLTDSESVVPQLGVCIWALTALTCAAGYVTVFLVALATDRAFLLHQPDDIHSRWQDIYEEAHISWRAEKYLDLDAERTRDDFIHLDLWCAASSEHDPAATVIAACVNPLSP